MSGAIFLPITSRQNFFLMREFDPKSSDALRRRSVMSFAMLVRPKVDIRRLTRAWNRVYARHDSLRLKIEQPHGGFRKRIDPPEKVTIREIDLGDVDDAKFHDQVTEVATGRMDMIDAPLAEMVVLHFGERGDAVVLRVHHAITDANGLILLIEDTIKFLIGMPMMSRAVSHVDYVKRFLTLPPSRAAQIEDFWRAKHKDLPKAPMIGRKAKGLEPLWYNIGDAAPAMLKVDISERSMDAFLERLSSAGLNRFSALSTAFLESMCQTYDTPALAYSAVVSRSDPALKDFAGPHYFDPILAYRTSDGVGFDEAVRRVQSDITLANEHLPSDAAIQATQHEHDLVASGVFPRQFSIHQPRPMARLKQSVFGSAFSASSTKAHRLGPYVVSKINMSKFTNVRNELRVILRDGGGAPGINFEFDALAYTDDEMAVIAARMCDMAALECEDSSFVKV